MHIYTNWLFLKKEQDSNFVMPNLSEMIVGGNIKINMNFLTGENQKGFYCSTPGVFFC